jgi:hypothetical protein
MTSVNPLMQLLRVPKGSRDQVAIRALLTANPDLANTQMTRAPESKPLSYTLTTADIVTSALLVEFGAKANKAPLQEAAWSTDLPTLEWVFNSGLDTDVTSDPYGLSSSVLSPRVASDATVVPMFNFLIPKGLRIPLGLHLLALQRYPQLVKFLVSRGWFTVDMYTGPVPSDRSLQESVKLGLLTPPFTYALLPDASNGLVVAVTESPVEGPVSPALQAAIRAAGPTGSATYTIDSEVVDTGSPLFHALYRGNVPAATALLAAHANALHRRPSGETCVGAAVRSGSVAAIDFIVSAIKVRYGPVAALDAVNAVYVNSRGSQRTALANAIVSYTSAEVVAKLLALNADPSKVLDGVPTPALLGYAVQDRAAVEARPAFNASALFRLLVAGNAAGVKPDIDTYVPVLRASVRDFNTKYGVTL